MAVECRIDGNILRDWFKSGNFTSQMEMVGLKTVRCCKQPRFTVMAEALLGVLFNQGLTGGAGSNPSWILRFFSIH